MKILLIRYHDKENINSREIRNIVGNIGIWPPLGLVYVATMLKKHGYAVEIIDCIARRLDGPATRRILFDKHPSLVGITATTPEIRGVLEVARFAKEAGAKVVIGGPHAGIFPEETMSATEVDFAIEGDGEIPLLRLVQLLHKGEADYASVPGLIYKKGTQVYRNGAYVERNLDTIPFPDWGFLNLDSYSRADALKPFAAMVSARGCPYQCGFCYRGSGGIVCRFRNPVLVVDEMEYIGRNWGAKEVIFCNDTLTLDRENITGICEELLKRNLKMRWQGATRVDRVDQPLLRLMKRAGCKQLKFGVESGNDTILQVMKKGITKEQVRRAILWCKKERIKSGAYFILGYVDENEQTIKDTISFARELDADFSMFYAGVPLPQTDFHDLAVQRKKISPFYWPEYVCGKRNDRLEYLVPNLDFWVQRAFRAVYARPKFILRQACNPDIWKAVLRNPTLILSLFFPKNT